MTRLLSFSKITIRDPDGTGDRYLVRWSMFLPGGSSLKLHLILRPDADRCPHDHPWWFCRVILWGGYVEEVGPERRLVMRKPWRPWAPWRIYYAPPKFQHRIVRLLASRVVTLCLCGPQERRWGFHTRSGWVFWKIFNNADRAARVAWCDDGRPPLRMAPSKPRRR